MQFSKRVGAVLTAMAVVAWMAGDSFAQRGGGSRGGGSRGGSAGRGSSGGGSRSFGGGGSRSSGGGSFRSGGSSSRSFGGGGSSRSFGGGSSSRSSRSGSSSRSFGSGGSSRSSGGGSSSRSFGGGSSGSPSFGGGFRSGGSGNSTRQSPSFRIGGDRGSSSGRSGDSSPSFGGGFRSGGSGNSSRQSPSFRIGGDRGSSSGRSGSDVVGRSFPRSGSSSSSSLGGFSRSDFGSNRGQSLNPSHRIGGNSRDGQPRVFSSPNSNRSSGSSSSFARSTPRYSSGRITDGFRKPINIDRNTPYRRDGGRGHDHDHGRNRGGSRFFFGFGYPLYTPLLFGNYGFYNYRPYGYAYDYGYGYGAPYSTTYANNYYTYSTVDSYNPVDIEGESVPAETPQDNTLAQADPSGVGDEYLAEAEAAFREKDYRQAVRLGSHAAVELPEDAGVHGLLWLSLTALGEYQSAAVEAHAVVHFGADPKWENVRGYYATAADFTPHLRALEAYVREQPDSPYGTFLLGYTYQVIGHKEHAKTKLEQAVKLAPGDAIARKLFEAVGGDPSTIPEPAAPAKTPPEPGSGESGEASASAGVVSGPVLAPVP